MAEEKGQEDCASEKKKEKMLKMITIFQRKWWALGPLFAESRKIWEEHTNGAHHRLGNKRSQAEIWELQRDENECGKKEH